MSNTGQAASIGSHVIGLRTGGDHFSQATTFTTGAHADGYTLSAVDVGLGTIGTTAVVQVSLYSTSSGVPNTSLQVLSNPASIASRAVNTFTATANTKLDADTTYAIVVENTRATERQNLDAAVSTTTSTAEDMGAATGWSISNARYSRDTNGAAWAEQTSPLLMAIKGYARDTTAPTVQTAAVNGSTLTLTFDEALDTTTAPAASRFTVAGTDSVTTVTAAAFKSGAAKAVELTVSPAVTHGDTEITVSYAKGDDTNPLKDTAPTPNEVADFSAQTVTNNTPMPSVIPLPTVSIAGGGPITAGGPARFTVRASAAPPSNLRIGLALTATGGVLAPWSGTIDILASTTSSVFTSASTAAATSGTVTVTLQAGTGYTVSSAFGTATVAVTAQQPPDPPGQDPQQPQPDAAGTPGLRLKPGPLQLALWTDRPGYRVGETVRLYRTLDPHDDRGLYRTFVYLERAGGGERRYLAPLTAAGELHPEPVDHRGMPADLAPARTLAAADRTLSWEGEAPAPGLWQFVLELRPGSAEEQFEEFEEPLRTRRAWAKFVVAERSLLFNRRDFDREIRNDLTLRSDTIYYLGHQLFVHDGATLTIEPGTLVQAWGQNAAIVVEPGGRIVAEGTREAPVVMTCSVTVGWRQPGCWGGLRILGRAPVTRLEGVAPGVLPAGRAVYGGADAEGSSGALRYVRVEFAGAGGDPDDPEAAAPAIGLYGTGSGTVLDHVQAHASLGDGFAFHGGTAACDHCVASNSGRAGLSWERGWRGGASHLYVQHGDRGLDGLVGGHDEEGHDREPRSLPTLSNATLIHSVPYGRRGRKAVGVQLSDGSAAHVRDLLATRFRGGAIRASGRSRLLFGEGESSVVGALLYLNGSPQVPGGLADAVEFRARFPKLRDVRDFPNPDPRPKAKSPALPDEGEGYIGAFGPKDNWLEEWTVFGPESVYDLSQRDHGDN